MPALLLLQRHPAGAEDGQHRAGHCERLVDTSCHCHGPCWGRSAAGEHAARKGAGAAEGTTRPPSSPGRGRRGICGSQSWQPSWLQYRHWPLCCGGRSLRSKGHQEGGQAWGAGGAAPFSRSSFAGRDPPLGEEMQDLLTSSAFEPLLLMWCFHFCC